MKPTLLQYQGCLIGQCLGDALGFPVEGYGPEYCRLYAEKYLNKTPEKMLGYGHYPFGQYTDDSQLARELIQSYIENNGELHPKKYAMRIAAIFAEDRIVGRGLATDQAAKKLNKGVPWEDSGMPPPHAGNGSAMRAAPIGLFFFDDPDLIIRGAIDQGRITHTDPRCHAGAVAIAMAVALVLQEKKVDSSSFVRTLEKHVESIDDILTLGIRNLHDWIQLSPENAVKQIAPYGQNLEDYEGGSWRNISPFVVPSVLWSLYSFLKFSDNFMKAITTSIVVGGDVDTTAAMTGAISGAYLGLNAIPTTLAKKVTDQGMWEYKELCDLVDEVYKLKFTVKE
ncbi:MAG: ADP-ribosylglycohydrolase family protein [Candidatus Hodarchaeales archaeon]|jgi:ADP-ribosylglycohydrolase